MYDMKCTFKGRVVYDRPKHFWTAKGVLRTYRSLHPADRTQFLNWIGAEIPESFFQDREKEVIEVVRDNMKTASLYMIQEIIGLIPFFPNKWESTLASKAYDYLEKLVDLIVEGIKGVFSGNKQED